MLCNKITYAAIYGKLRHIKSYATSTIAYRPTTIPQPQQQRTHYYDYY